MMSRMLKDTTGRALRLAEGDCVEDGVLLVAGEPLIVLEDPDSLPPAIMDSIARSLLGSELVEHPD